MAQTVKILILIPADLLMSGSLSPPPPRAIVGQPYSYSGTILLGGGILPYKVPVLIGPTTSNGLTIAVSGSNVTITGIPTAAANFEINVDDSTP